MMLGSQDPHEAQVLRLASADWDGTYGALLLTLESELGRPVSHRELMRLLADELDESGEEVRWAAESAFPFRPARVTVSTADDPIASVQFVFSATDAGLADGTSGRIVVDVLTDWVGVLWTGDGHGWQCQFRGLELFDPTAHAPLTADEWAVWRFGRAVAMSAYATRSWWRLSAHAQRLCGLL